MQKFLTCFFGSLLLVLLFTCLYRSCQWFEIPSYLIPTIGEVAQVFVDDAPILYTHFLTTAQEWLLGIGIAIILGILIALCAFYSKIIKTVLTPLLILSQSVPYLVFTPLLLIWFGVGISAKVILVVLTCFFPISVVLIDGLLRAQKEYKMVCSMLKLSPIKSLFHVYFPYSLPLFFNSLKITCSYAFVSTVLAELMGSASGLGVYLVRAQGTYRTDKIIAASLLVVIVSMMSLGLIGLLKKKFIPW